MISDSNTLKSDLGITLKPATSSHASELFPSASFEVSTIDAACVLEDLLLQVSLFIDVGTQSEISIFNLLH